MMRPCSLILPILLGGSLLASAREPAAIGKTRVQHEKSARLHSIDAPGQWGVDLSPDGSAVAVAVLRKNDAAPSKQDEVFVDIEVRDFRANRLLARRTLSHRPAHSPVTAEWGQVRYSSDGRLLLVYDGELLSVLRATDLDEITRIDLGLPSWPRDSQVVDLALPRDAARQVAVLISWGGGRGGALRLYDLQNGHLRQQWEWDHGYPELGGHVAWRPDGLRVAVTRIPVVPGDKLPAEEKNVQVMDTATGKVVAEFNTGYVAGPVCFTSDDRLITATAEPAWDLLTGTHKIKTWSAASGRLLRELDSTASGVRGSLALSANEKTLLGYTGSERSASHFGADDPTEILEQRFREWDLTTGRAVFTSPKIVPNPGQRASLRLNSRGDLVLVYWQIPDKPILVYEIE